MSALIMTGKINLALPSIVPPERMSPEL
jgi:hypothetical protein